MYLEYGVGIWFGVSFPGIKILSTIAAFILLPCDKTPEVNNL
jgi:hypothetical protein